MNQCPNCRNQIPEGAAFCPVCGTAINAFHSFPEPYPPQQPVNAPPVYIPPVPKINPYDHTSHYMPEDISESKLFCMLCYLLDFIGIIIALLGAQESEYAKFHIRQAIKFTVLEALLTMISLFLCWTILVPALAAIALVVLSILKLLCFIDLCKGKAVEPAIVRSIKFLK